MLNHLLPVINSETTTIPHILRKHGLDPECVLEEANFPLLELDAPAVCADRLDYGIRDAHSFGFTTAEEARNIYQQILCLVKKGDFASRVLNGQGNWQKHTCKRMNMHGAILIIHCYINTP
jgi:hypothetical protein